MKLIAHRGNIDGANPLVENQPEAILTEAMAEVYLKQGLREKAIDVYNKLSLQNPNKSAYFAARITEIEQQQKEI